MPDPITSSLKPAVIGATAGVFVSDFAVPALIGALASLAVIALVESDPPITKMQAFRRMFGSAIVAGFATRGTMALLSLDPVLYRELVSGVIGIVAAGAVAWLSNTDFVGGILDSWARTRKGRNDGDS